MEQLTVEMRKQIAKRIERERAADQAQHESEYTPRRQTGPDESQKQRWRGRLNVRPTNVVNITATG